MDEARTAAVTAGKAVARAAAALESAPLHIKAMAGKELAALSDALRAIHAAQLQILELFAGGGNGK